MQGNIDKSGVIALVLTALITVSFSLIAIYRGFDWQNILSRLNSWVINLLGNEVVAVVFIIIISLIVYIFISVGLNEVLRIPRWESFKVFAYIYIEWVKLYFLIMPSFLVVTAYMFKKSEDKLFTSDIFFKITIFTFIVSIIIYFIFKKVSKYLLKRNQKHILAKNNEKKMLREFEVSGIVNALVILVTVLLLADTIGNTAYDSIIKQINCEQVDCGRIKPNTDSPKLDDFMNSRIFFLMIPSLAVYILSIKLGFPKGFKKV